RQVCENIAPFAIVPAPPRAPAEPIPQGDRLLRLWNDFQKSRAIQRLDSRELKNHLPELARVLAAKHRELARWGRSGKFHSFLREHQIPRQTAYRLIRKFVKCEKTKDISCTNLSGTRGPWPRWGPRQ